MPIGFATDCGRGIPTMTDLAAVRVAGQADMAACAEVFNDWVDATSWMPRVHSRKDVTAYYVNVVGPQQTVWIAELCRKVKGFVSCSENFVTALYLAPEARGKGLGKELLDTAKSAFPDGLSLWAFVANRRARDFYQREGFREVRRTDGDNEEGLPDILFRWTSTGKTT